MDRFSLTIRPITEADIPALDRDLAFGIQGKHADRLARQRRGHVVYLIAWHNQTPVGHALLKWYGAEEAHIVTRIGGTCPDVEDLFVAEAWRSHGIGTWLLQSAESLARQRDFRQVGLSVGVDENPRARALYERLGYHDANFGAHTERGTYVDADGVTQTWEETCVYLIKKLDTGS